MDENPSFTIRYTKRADADAIIIKNYLLYKFTQKEVDHFYQLLGTFEKVIVAFPELYTLSINGKNMHRAVLSKQLSIFYRISKNRITINSILDNRMNPSKWP
jgi:plasmid stabilization system protein ParE